MTNKTLSASRDKLLFTPGPLTTSHTVKRAMLHDAGSWHWEFNALVASLRERLLALAGVSRDQGYECILMQGTGTFGVEAVFGTVVPHAAKVLILSNGAYGERMILMTAALRIPTVILRTPEEELPTAEAVREILQREPEISHVAMVHCETTTGILNPIEAIGQTVRECGRQFILDAMSSFGAIPIDFKAVGIDFMISSANKCIEGVPGFSFVIGRRSALLASEGIARSLSLDLLSQLRGFEKNGQFRYTPPTHSILAFEVALDELEEEGGVTGRAQRYAENHRVLLEGMTRLGFRAHLDPSVQSYIITSFHYPQDPRFDFSDLYRRMSEKGMIIYPGKLTKIDCFRIGNIGRLFPADLRQVVGAVEASLREMGLTIPIPAL